MTDRYSFLQFGCGFYNTKYIKWISCNNETRECEMIIANTETSRRGKNTGLDTKIKFDSETSRECMDTDNKAMWFMFGCDSNGCHQ